KECQTRVEQIVDPAVDQSGRWLLEVIDFKIDCAAQSRAKIVLKRGKGKRCIQPIEEIIHFKGMCRRDENAENQRSNQCHAASGRLFCGGGAMRRRSSNSVQSFSERTSLKLPPCSRMSSRAKIRPSP